MGELQIIDGSGLTATFTDNGVIIEPSVEHCELCNDDRLLHEGDLLRCYSCHAINRIPQMPNYDYMCDKEGTLIVLDLPMDHKIPLCQVCSIELRRVYTAVPTIFKGSGWASKDG